MLFVIIILTMPLEFEANTAAAHANAEIVNDSIDWTGIPLDDDAGNGESQSNVKTKKGKSSRRQTIRVLSEVDEQNGDDDDSVVNETVADVKKSKSKSKRTRTKRKSSKSVAVV